jgi:4-amino-4-deoxy-L-arabinose transferase-like glycosyltransferase
MSVVYGSLALLLMSWTLTRCNVAPPTQAIVLCFIATTPAFLFMFTTYNNDSLATFLSVGILATAYAWISEGRGWQLVLLGILSTAGLYTKLTVVFCLASLLCVLGFLLWRKKLTFDRIAPVAGVLTISVLLLTPWLIGHNYHYTGRLSPTAAESYINDRFHLPSAPLRTLLTPPGWSQGEWKTPYVQLWENTNHKKNSYLAYLFDTSVFDEYTFEFMPPAIPWAIVTLHGFLWIAALFRARQSPYGVLSLSLILLGFILLPALIFKAPFSGFMDFRHIAWVWLPGAVLYSTCLITSARPNLLNSFSRAAMISGTFLHGLLWLALMAGGHWNIP